MQGPAMSGRLVEMTAESPVSALRQYSLLLIANDSAAIRLIVDRASKAGWRTIVCGGIAQARGMLNEDCPAEISAVILDEATGPEGPYDVIVDLKCLLPQVPILLMTAGDPSRLPIS